MRYVINSRLRAFDSLGVFSVLLLSALASPPMVRANELAEGQGKDSSQLQDSTATLRIRDSKPNFIVLPINTELQREFLDGDKTLKVYAEINGRSLLNSTNLANSIDVSALEKALIEANGEAKDAKVVFKVNVNDLRLSPEILDQLGQELIRIARAAKLQDPHIDYSYGYYDWDAKVKFASSINLAEDNVEELGVGDPLAIAYPVRNKVSRFIADADCVVFFRKPPQGIDDPLISDPTKSRLGREISMLNLDYKGTILFRVKLRKLAQEDYEAFRPTRDRLLDELQKFGKSIEFEHSVVSFH